MTSELKSMFGENYSEQANQPQQNSQKENDKKKKDYIKKQTGLKRELIKLIGGVPSIVERTSNKNYKGGSNWVWAPFTNPARSDNLKLVHWQRAEDVNKDYDFAKLNQNIDIVEFTKEEYDTLIKPNDRNWNYEQTCYLWDLIKRYELRFIVIMDRFDEEKYGERTVESLKDRYYSVARTILESRKMFDHPIIKSGYNYEQEMRRRTYLEKTMKKSFAELKEENLLFEMAENLNKKMEKNEKFEKAIHQKLSELKFQNYSSTNSSNVPNNTIQIPMVVEDGDNSLNGYSENKNINTNLVNTNENIFSQSVNQPNKINIDPLSVENDNNQTFEDFIKSNVTKNDSFVFLRSQKIRHNLPVSEKIQERVNNYMNEFNLNPQKLIPTAKVEIAYDNLRNNIILFTSLKKFLEKKDKEYTFLQSKFKEYQSKVNPSNNQGNSNVQSSSHPPMSKSNLKSDKNIAQFNKSNPKTSTQNEIKEQENNPELSTNKSIISNINSNTNIKNNVNNNIAPGTTNSINPLNGEASNTNTINNNNTNTQESIKQNGPKEKKRKINGTPKVRKRKNMNEEEAPTNEEKEPKSNSKKKKKGTK